jgi:hypothetical protein
MMQTAAFGSSILRGFITSSKAATGSPKRLMTVGDLDGGFVTAPSSGVGTVLPKTIATVVSVTNPTSAIDRTIVRNVAHARSILFDVLT